MGDIILGMDAKESRMNRGEEGGNQKIIPVSEIRLGLDDYDELFSDFDPRPYLSRALSQDFLDEARRASRNKAYEGLELNLMIATNKRNGAYEPIIKKRLHDHFKKHHTMLKKEVKSIFKMGAAFVILGIISMFAVAVVLFENRGGILQSFLIIMLEPAGWFFFWEGLNQIIFESKKKSPELEFYEKMAKCKVNFLNS